MARPMMEREPAEPDLALLVGPSKGGSAPPGGGMMDEPMEEAEELPPGFEAAAVEAFPDMDPASYPALKRLIATCMGEPGY
jgi:hypothetical protein